MRKTSANNGRHHGAADQSDTQQGALDEYRRKRDPASTTEPFGPEHNRSSSTWGGRFVVHLHAATRTHYDLRLEVSSTLKSFAVPRGPTLDPGDKRLAVNTEDHPLEYLDFEDVIPKNNYGAGPMIAWDRGTVRYLEHSAEEGLRTGKVDFELCGHKLRGRFGLIHTGKRSKTAPDAEWLLVKKSDEFATTDHDVLVQAPHSVFSGLLIEELPRKTEIAAALADLAGTLGAKRGEVETRQLTPMLCSDSEVGLTDRTRLYELKLDGVRIVADRRQDTVALRYRSGLLVTHCYPEIARAMTSLAPARVVLDGEIVTFDEHGRPRFQRLGPRISARRPNELLRAIANVPVVYIVFDVLALGDFDLRALPLTSRKQILSELTKGQGFIRVLPFVEDDGRALLELCNERKLEGVVAKRKTAPYRPGPRRSHDWIKLKCAREDDFVVVGWITGKGSRKLGALCLASYAGGRLVIRGKVGGGLDSRTLDLLGGRLAELAVEHPPAIGNFELLSGKLHHVRPELVVSVRHTGWTDDARLRAPVFRGLRADIAPSACMAAPSDEQLSADPAPSNEPTVRVSITNADKVFWPDEGYTKGDLCSYYAAVAPAMLPFLHDRPIVLVRYPDGIHGKSFYQWHPPRGTPKWLRTLEVYDDAGQRRHAFLVDDADALVHIANLGAIPIHVLPWRAGTPESCDFLTIDFDVGEQPLKHAVKLALDLHELLAELGLPGYAKTSGQKGLHVLVPLGRGIGFDTAKLLAELLGRILATRNSDIATVERRVNKRGPRVYVDTGQTGESRTIVAPYSVRAYPGATVSTPLTWDEVHLALEPQRHQLQSVPLRLAETGDPMRSMLDEAPDVGTAIARIERWVR